METFDTSAKIKCLLEMALRGEMMWLNLNSLIDSLTLNLETSKLVNRILLKEFETHQSNCTLKKSNAENNISKGAIQLDEDQSITEAVKTFQVKDSTENKIKIIEKRKFLSEVISLESDDVMFEDNENDLSNTNVLDQSESKSCGTEPEFETTHTSEKSFQCQICRKGFALDKNLKRHQLTHTSKKPYKCKVCDKYFKHSKDLTNHGRIHTGEKPFQCKTCEKRFTWARSLREHKIRHTGEKTYKCFTCNKCFIQSSDLTKHERTHTGENPFQCQT